MFMIYNTKVFWRHDINDRKKELSEPLEIKAKKGFHEKLTFEFDTYEHAIALYETRNFYIGKWNIKRFHVNTEYDRIQFPKNECDINTQNSLTLQNSTYFHSRQHRRFRT